MCVLTSCCSLSVVRLFFVFRAGLLVSFSERMVSCKVDSALVLHPSVDFRGCGDGVPSWIKLMCVVSMVPAGRSAAVVLPGWLCLRWGVVRPFAWFRARSDFLDASGAEAGKLPGRCCAAFL